jgi:hypothetical protein
MASAAPTLQPSPEPSAPAVDLSFDLNPSAPWAPRGEPVDEGTRIVIQNEYATKLQAAEVLVTPLYASTYEPSGLQEVVFLARVDGSYRWGISTSTESGPEFLWDEPLPPAKAVPGAEDPVAFAVALAAQLPGDEGVPRLLVVAAPGTEVQYRAVPNEEYVDTGEEADGIGLAPLEGDVSAASYRVVDGTGRSVVEAAVPGPGPSQGASDPYAFDPADPWDYRGPVELDNPNLAVEDERLFVETDPARGDGSWGQRPLYAGDSDAGMSFLLMLHIKPGEDPVVTTTWQRGDREAEQAEQRVEPGQRIIQSLIPTDLDDGSVLLIALASPEAGIALDQPELGLREDGIGDPGVGLWILDKGKRDGMIRIYESQAEIYAEPVDVGPDADN